MKAKKLLKINIGAGETKLKGFVNIDGQRSTKPDLVLDIVKEKLPYKHGEVDVIYMLHCIEHIQEKFHLRILLEFHRVLKMGGILVLAYPEFEKCVDRYLNNYKGQRDFYKMTIFGRQSWPGDFHVCPINSAEMRNLVQVAGFTQTKLIYEEAPDDAYALLSAKKGKRSITYEDVLRKEMFNVHE